MSLLKTILAFFGVDDMPPKVKSGYKTCPDGSVVRANVKCPVPTATLGTLALSSTSFRRSVTASGMITGTTIGSAITASGLPTGLTIDSNARTWAWSGTGSGVASGSVTLTETKIGALGTPKANSISYSIAAAAPTLGTLRMALPTLVRGVVSAGAITGASTGSTITATSLPSGLTINSTDRSWAWDGTGSGAITGSCTLTEVLAGATNTPLDTNVAYGISTEVATTVLYDTRFGTATSSDGWFTFGLKSGCRRVWCNSAMADDTGNGLTAATAKKTLPAAWTVFTNGSWAAGDQLMLAGTANRTYTDDALGVGWNHYAGFSATYPTAVLCYDPADAANASKYGKLLGQDRPRYLYPDPATVPSYQAGSSAPILENQVNNGSSNFVVQGLIIDGQNRDGAGTGSVGRHDNTAWQNCQFKQILLGNNNAQSNLGLSQSLNVSKSSFYGAWRALNGNTSGMFTDDVDGLWVQDCVFVHCGWKIGSSRDDTTANGGTSVFGHSCYYAAGNINGRFDRNVTMDSASDGPNLRGSAAATQIATIDEPIAASVTGFSSTYLDNATGSIVTYDDVAVIGGADLWSTAATATKGDGARGSGFGGKNSRASGTRINNVAMFDNPKKDDGNSVVFSFDNTDPAQVNQVYAISNVRAHNYSAVALGTFFTTGNQSKLVVNMTDCLLDTLVQHGSTGSPTAVTGSGVRTWTVDDYPDAITKADLLSTLGLTKNALANAMLDYAHLPWAQTIVGVSLPAFGLTPQYATVSASTLTTALAALPSPAVVYS